jgi:hypothetical protein
MKKILKTCLYLALLFSQNSYTQGTKYNYLSLTTHSFAYWVDDDFESVKYVDREKNDFDEQIKSIEAFKIKTNISSKDSIWNNVVYSLKENSNFIKKSPNIIWETTYFDKKNIGNTKKFSWTLFNLDNDSIFKFEKFKTKLNPKNTNEELFKSIIRFIKNKPSNVANDEDISNLIKLLPDSLLSKPYKNLDIKNTLISYLNQTKPEYELRKIKLEDEEKLILIKRKSINFFKLPHLSQIEPQLNLDITKDLKDKSGNNIWFLILIAFLILGYYFLKKQKTKYVKIKNIFKVLKEYINQLILKNKQIKDLKTKNNILFKEKESLLIVYKKYGELKGKFSELRDELELNKKNNEKIIFEEVERVSNKYINELNELNEKLNYFKSEILKKDEAYLYKIETLKKDWDDERLRFNIDIKSHKHNYNNLKQYVEETLIIIRDIDLALSRNVESFQEWDNEKTFNNIIRYLLGLRTELNIVYCLFSDTDIEFQITNLNDLLPNENDKFNKLRDVKKDLVKIEIKKDNQFIEKYIMKQVYTFYNKRVNSFPKEFHYGVNEDDIIN